MTLIEFFTELESHHPNLTVDSLGRIRQYGPAPGEMSCPLQIVFGKRGYMNRAGDAGLTERECTAIISAADYSDCTDLVAKKIRKRLLEMMYEGEQE